MHNKGLHVLTLLTLIAFVAGIALAIRNAGDSDEKQQVAFLTNVDKAYLAGPPNSPRPEPAAGTFYSTATEAEIAGSYRLCERLSRSDGVCGDGADWDVFLQTQETAPDLDFKSSRFVAVKSGHNMIDVSFTVWPGQGAEEDRTLRYMLVKERAAWRVADVLPQIDGKFPLDQSIHVQTAKEKANLDIAAADLAETLDWIFIFVRTPDMADRVARFIASPVEICERAGPCRSARNNDARLIEIVAELRHAYFKGDNDVTTDLRLGYPKVPAETPADGSTARYGALELTFRDKGWWITRIDLKRLPSVSANAAQKNARNLVGAGASCFWSKPRQYSPFARRFP